MKDYKLWYTFWPSWIIANLIGWSFFYLDKVMPFGRILTIFYVAMAVGFCQWLVLKKFLDINFLWFWASIPSYASFVFVIYGFLLIGKDGFDLFKMTMVFAFTFGLVALFQKAALDQYFDQTWLWAVANPIAGLLALYLSTIFSNQAGINWTGFGLTYGLLSGVAIIVLAMIPVKKYFD